MSRGRIHIARVDIPEMGSAFSGGLGLAAAVAEMGLSTVDVVITFGDGSIYQYPNVPAGIAVALAADPEGVFPTVRYWPGYHRI